MTLATEKLPPDLRVVPLQTIPVNDAKIAWERLVVGGVLWYAGVAALWKTCEWAMELGRWAGRHV